MDFLETLKIILLGIIEGITEWLPVSSTGHMILVNYFLPLNKVSNAFVDMFEYVIQLAAILAVIVIFWNKLFPFRLEKQTQEPAQNAEVTEENEETPAPVTKTKYKLNTDMGIIKLWLKVIIACVPAVLALLVDQLFENFSPLVESLIIACALIVYGLVFILIETFHRKEPKVKEISELSYKYAFFIGCFQVLASIPGTSRSGITIIGALLLGVSRTAATEFTFFLAIPTMVGASAYKLLKFFLDAGRISGAEIGYLAVGSIVAFAISLVAIRFLTNFVKKHDFKIFGWYRIALGIIVIAALVIPPLVA